MNAKQLYQDALAQATEIVEQVTPADYDKPTPATEWDVHDLINHTLNELCWTADIVEGRTVAEVGEKYDGDLLGEGRDLQHLWRAAEEAAIKAIQVADLHDIVHVSYDDITTEEYLCQAGTDQLIHAWDLAQALDAPIEFDQDLAEAAYAYLLPQGDHLHETGLFAEPVTVPDDAPVQVKLLALTGRQVAY